MSSASYGKFDRIAPNEASQRLRKPSFSGFMVFHHASFKKKATNLQPTRKKGIAPVSSNAEKEPLLRVSESEVSTKAGRGQLLEDSGSRAVRRWLHRQAQSRQGLMAF